MDLQADIDAWPEIATSCTGAAGAAQIAAQASVKRLVMVHLGDTTDDPERRDAMLAEARAQFDGDSGSCSARTSSKSPSPPDARSTFTISLTKRRCGQPDRRSFSLSLWERVGVRGLPVEVSRASNAASFPSTRGEGWSER